MVLPVLLGVCVALAGCRGSRNAESPREVADRNNDRGPVAAITIDGSDEDWPADRAPVADREYLYVPLSSDGTAPLQGAPETMQLLIDADASAATGSGDPLPRDPSLRGLGVDMVIEFSPADGPGQGAAVFAVDASGRRTSVGHAGIGLVALPTHAAEFYELRFRRTLPGVPGLPTEGLQSSGAVAGLWVLRDGAGDVLGWSDPFTLDLPSASGGPTLADADVPGKAATDFRIVSYNVNESSPLKDPGPFGRVLEALNPDVILFQEWDEGSPQDIEAWLTAQVGSEEGWSVIRGVGGVAIASKHPLRPAGPDELSLSAGEPVRFVAGIVETPSGDMGVSSVHLTCCGTSDSPEDRRRLAEAGAINRELAAAFAETPIRVVAGDFNLVGSGGAMPPLRSGLDVDGADLGLVDALVLGDRVATTWSNPPGRFVPGRLDYALVGFMAAEVSQAFILDTRILSSAALGRAGLEQTDSGASDHLPLVFDIRGR